MSFLIYQSVQDPENFIVTDVVHKDQANAALSAAGEELKGVGTFEEMGRKRAAFDESLAKRAIAKQGYYRVHAEHLADVPVAPEMPG